MSELTPPEMEHIAELVASDFRARKTREGLRMIIGDTLQEKGVAPGVIKGSHLLMAHVVGRMVKETGKRAFKMPEIQGVFEKARELLLRG